MSARKMGWKVIYVTGARAVHHRGGSAPVKSLSSIKKRLPAYYYASRTRLFYKAYGRRGLLAANVLWTLGECVSWIRRVFGSSTPGPHEKELFDIWINFLTPLGDRRAP